MVLHKKVRQRADAVMLLLAVGVVDGDGGHSGGFGGLDAA